MSTKLGLKLARLAGSLPRGSRHFIKRIAKAFPELQATPVESRHGIIYCDLRERVCNEIFRKGGYSHTFAEEDYFAANLKADDVVFDVGANVGYMAIQFAQRVRHVHLFEPAPRAVRLLRKTLELYPNMTLYPVAVSDSAGIIAFQEEKGLDMSHVDQQGIPVPAITLDSIGILPTFIKIDVEGHEPEVLRGARRILAQGPTVLFEALTPEAFQESEAILRSANPNYRITRIAPGNRNYVARV